MENRNYNPLNEGYTGGQYQKKGYTGSSNASVAPVTLPSIQSAVVKPVVSQTTHTNNSSTQGS